jgi:hypothetical protein
MAKSQKPPQTSSDKELLDRIKKKISDQVDSGDIKLKVGDLLKILELQNKLSKDSSAEEKFWEMLEKIRQEELKDA